jgi:hypothetical protein
MIIYAYMTMYSIEKLLLGMLKIKIYRKKTWGIRRSF